MSNEEYLNESLRKIAKGAGIGFVGTLIGMAFSFFTTIIIARFLGPSDYGLISLGFAGITITATLSLMGLQTGIQRYVSFYKGKEDKERIKGTILGTLKISFPLSLISAILIFFGADWISVHVFHEVNLAPILRIFSISIPFFVLTQIFINAIVGFQEIKYQVYTTHLFHNILKLVVISSLLLLGFGVIGVASGWVLTIILTPFLAFYFLEKRIFPVFNTKVKSISVGKELFSFSWPLIIGTVTGLIMGWMDTLMLGYLSLSIDVGIYNVALQIAHLITIIPSTFAAIFFPVMSELYARNKIEDFRRTFSVVSKWILASILPVFLFLFLFPNQIIKILFGIEYGGGASALSTLTFAFMIGAVLSLNASILQTYGRTKILLAISCVTAAANFLLNLLLIPIYGVDGAAIATGFSFSLNSILIFFFAYKIAKTQPFRASFLKPVFASILAILVVYVLTKYVIGVSVFALIAMLFVFLLFYFFLLLLMKSFDEEDLLIMRAVDQRLGVKSDWIRGVIKRFL